MSGDFRSRFNKLIAAVFHMEVSEIRDDSCPNDIQAWNLLLIIFKFIKVTNV